MREGCVEGKRRLLLELRGWVCWGVRVREGCVGVRECGGRRAQYGEGWSLTNLPHVLGRGGLALPFAHIIIPTRVKTENKLELCGREVRVVRVVSGEGEGVCVGVCGCCARAELVFPTNPTLHPYPPALTLCPPPSASITLTYLMFLGCLYPPPSTLHPPPSTLHPPPSPLHPPPSTLHLHPLPSTLHHPGHLPHVP